MELGPSVGAVIVGYHYILSVATKKPSRRIDGLLSYPLRFLHWASGCHCLGPNPETTCNLENMLPRARVVIWFELISPNLLSVGRTVLGAAGGGIHTEYFMLMPPCRHWPHDGSCIRTPVSAPSESCKMELAFRFHLKLSGGTWDCCKLLLIGSDTLGRGGALVCTAGTFYTGSTSLWTHPGSSLTSL